MVSIKIKGAKEVAALYQKAPQLFKDEIKKAIVRSAFAIENKSAQEAPADTGTLRKSIETDVAMNGFMASIAPMVEYAEFVHEGHGIIRPKKGKVLAALATRAGVKSRAKYASRTRNGYIFFGKQVRAVKANRFMKRGLLKSEGKVRKIFLQAQRNILKKLTV